MVSANAPERELLKTMQLWSKSSGEYAGFPFFMGSNIETNILSSSSEGPSNWNPDSCKPHMLNNFTVASSRRRQGRSFGTAVGFKV